MRNLWQTLLTIKVPLISILLQRVAINRLVRASSEGDALATRIIATSLLNPDLIENHDLVIQGLKKPIQQPCLDQAWQVWIELEPPALLPILQYQGKPALQPTKARVISTIMLDHPRISLRMGKEEIEILLLACTDQNTEISQRAITALSSLTAQSKIDFLCIHWARTRSVEIGRIIQSAGYVAKSDPQARVLTSLLQGDTLTLMSADSLMVEWLSNACLDQDPILARKATQALCMLQNPYAIEKFCALWAKSRLLHLSEVLLKAHYLPEKNSYLRLICSLKLGNLDIAMNCSAKQLGDLLALWKDNDPDISSAAEMALCSLKKTATQAALCELYISTQNPDLERIILDRHYLPRDRKNRALVLLLTEQWEEYLRLDFDHRILQTVYKLAKRELRIRILQKLQKSGRIEVLHSILGSNYSENLAVTKQESDLMISVLTSNQDWPRLWELCFHFEPATSLQIIRKLVASNWFPQSESDKRTYSLLAQYANPHLEHLLDRYTLDGAPAIPLALPITKISVQGRINSISLSPEKRNLAIGLTEKQTIIWNLERGAADRIIKGFDHSVGIVIYADEARLVMAETSHKNEKCTVFLHDQNGNTSPLVNHAGKITSVQVLNNCQIISTGRDGSFLLTDSNSEKTIQRLALNHWARSIGVSPDKKKILVLADEVLIFNTEMLFAGTSHIGYIHKGKFSSCAFLKDNRTILLGNRSGEVYLYDLSTSPSLKQIPDTGCDSSILYMKELDHSPSFILASENGTIQRISLANSVVTGMLATDHEDMIAVCTSEDETILITSDKHEVKIWDMSIAHLRDIIARPLNQMNHYHAFVVASLISNEKVPSDLFPILTFLKTLFDYKFRFDVFATPTNHILPGDFDIQIA